MSKYGIYLMVVLIISCFPLFWIAFFLKDEWHECSDCGIKIS